MKFDIFSKMSLSTSYSQQLRLNWEIPRIASMTVERHKNVSRASHCTYFHRQSFSEFHMHDEFHVILFREQTISLIVFVRNYIALVLSRVIRSTDVGLWEALCLTLSFALGWKFNKSWKVRYENGANDVIGLRWEIHNVCKVRARVVGYIAWKERGRKKWSCGGSN